MVINNAPSRNLTFLSAGYEKCEKNHSWGPAIRDFYVVHFVSSGRCHYYLSDEHYKVEADQCFLIPPYMPVFYHADANESCTYSWIDFKGEDARSILERCGLSIEHPVMRINDIDEIRSIIQQCLACEEHTDANALRLQSLMLLIFSNLEMHGAGNSAPDISPEEDALVSHAIDFIRDHISEGVEVNTVAKALFISRTSLFNAFKSIMSTSPQRFIQRARLSKACDYLVRTDMSIRDISKECGYANAFAFSRAFKKEYSLSPREYRQKYASHEHIIHHDLSL